MNRSEIAQLLALAAAYDRRTIGETDVVAWHRTLEPLDYDDAAIAVVDYYRDDTRPIMPAHITTLVRQAANDRAMRRQAITAGKEAASVDWVRRLRQSAPAYLVQDDDGHELWRGPATGLRDLVLRHPDLKARLTDPPLSYTRPEQWSGYVPPLVYGDRRNESRTRAALLKIVRAALARRDQREAS